MFMSDYFKYLNVKNKYPTAINFLNTVEYESYVGFGKNYYKVTHNIYSIELSEWEALESEGVKITGERQFEITNTTLRLYANNHAVKTTK